MKNVDAGLTEELKRFARVCGVDLIGVAPIERFEGAPEGHKPRDILSSAQSIVSIGLNALEGTFSTPLFDVYQLS